MRIEFDEDSLYLPRKDIVVYSKERNIVGPVICLFLWVCFYGVMYYLAFHKKPIIENLVVFSIPCLLCIPRLWDISVVLNCISGTLKDTKHPCHVCIDVDIKEQILTQKISINGKEADTIELVNLAMSKCLRYRNYIAITDGHTLSLVPESKFSELPHEISSMKIENLNLGFSEKIYEKVIAELLPARSNGK